jgi:cardiolipin synthase
MTFKYAPAFCLMLFAGCSSLSVPAKNNSHVPAVQIEGAHGEISRQESKALLARAKNGSEPTGIFERHLAQIQRIAGSPLTTGNKVTLLMDGPSTYKSMYAAITDARDHINMETYSIEADEVGRRFVDALIAKQKHGVQVNLIYDSVGSGNTPAEFFQPLIDSGAKVLEFNPLNPLVLRKKWEAGRDHRKLLIVDGKVAFVGGVNISSVYSSGSFRSKPPAPGAEPWRDTHLRIEGPVVGKFQQFFLATWEQQNGEPIPVKNFFPKQGDKGNEIVRAVASSPDEDYNQMYVTLLSAINSAETYVYITNAYFIPDSKLLAALEQAATRGVDVRLLLPSKSDSNLVFYASHSFYDQLLAAGVKIYERKDALLHAKTALVDGVWSTVGSTNLDWLSRDLNQEVNAVVLGQEFGAQMKAMFEKDMASSAFITLENWRKRPIGVRLKELGARLCSRWL